MRKISLTVSLVAVLMLAVGCEEKESGDGRGDVTLQLVDQGGRGSLSLETCGSAGTVYALMGASADVDVNLTLTPSVASVLSITSHNNGLFSPGSTFVSYSVKCASGASGEYVLNAVTRSSDASFDGLSSSMTLKCVVGSATCTDTGGSFDEPDCTQYPACESYEVCNAANGCKASGSAGVRIVPLSGLVTTESGGQDTFQIVLDSKPSSDVVIRFTSDDPEEGVISPSEIRFTPGNWSEVQTVNVVGVDDQEQDGDVTWHVKTEVTSEDQAYNGLVVAQLTVINEDNEVPGEAASFVIKYNKAVVTSPEIELWETGLTDSFTMVATAAPIDDVVVRLESLDEGEVRVVTDPIVFTKIAWNSAKKITVQGVSDGVVDGDQHVELRFVVTSNDPRYDGMKLPNVKVTVHDTDDDPTQAVRIRLMSANTTTGNDQSYDGGEGKRIFQAMKPDIVMIQEFNMETDTIDNFVRDTFGNNYNYYRGTGDIPNGIISRYPIIERGQWASPQVSNRGFNWAVIDIPGETDLLAISVHLSTESSKQVSEMANLNAKIPTVSEGRYVVLGGDFNTSTHNGMKNNLADAFPLHASYASDSSMWPMDQKGNINTNAKRSNPYDYVLTSDELFKLEVPVVIGEGTSHARSYAHGHVFDSRVYSNLGELSVVSPVEAGDSGALNMQHMAVIRDFLITP